LAESIANWQLPIADLSLSFAIDNWQSSIGNDVAKALVL
jgi:hypothetical protein